MSTTDRDHPVRLLLDWLASGGRLSDSDLAELPLSEHVDRAVIEKRIQRAAAEISRLRRDGHRGRVATRVARDAAAEIIAVVGDPPRHDPNADLTDPRDLADLVRRT